jgi:DNA-binding MarR family transcriptional regulator
MEELNLYDRTIIHLDLHSRRVDESAGAYPHELTQLGAANAVGRTRAHMSIIFRNLETKGMITTSKERIIGEPQHMIVAHLTPSGRTAAAQVRRMAEANGKSAYEVVLAPQSTKTDLHQIMERIHHIQVELDELKALVKPMLIGAQNAGIPEGTDGVVE